jgi:hypothetical protein
LINDHHFLHLGQITRSPWLVYRLAFEEMMYTVFIVPDANWAFRIDIHA